jgi:hypothetical protein
MSRPTKAEKQEALEHARYVEWLLQLRGEEDEATLIGELPAGYVIRGPIGYLDWSPTGISMGGLHEVWLLEQNTATIASSVSRTRLVYAAQQAEGERRRREKY